MMRKTRRDNPTRESYLARQAQDTVFGTELDAIALAEKLNLNLFFTVTNDEGASLELTDNQGQIVEGLPDIPARTSNPNKNETIHLYNQNDIHFFTLKNQPTSTLGDGNCLYNGFSQQIQTLLRLEKTLYKESKHDMSAEEVKIYDTQQDIYKETIIYFNQHEEVTPLSYDEIMILKISTIQAGNLAVIPAEEPMAHSLNKQLDEGGIRPSPNSGGCLVPINPPIKENCFISMILQYGKGCAPILIGLSIGVIILSLGLTAGFSAPISIGIALATTVATSAFSFFAKSDKANEKEIYQFSPIDEGKGL